MRIDYMGKSEGCKHRVAMISFNEEKESTLMERIAFGLERVCGYKVDIIDSCAIIEVGDVNEYKDLVREYKEWKRTISRAMKFGF